MAKKNKSVRGLATEVLEKIEKNNSYSNISLNQTVKKNQLEQNDINILTELVYGVLQWKSALDYQLSTFFGFFMKGFNW